MKRTSVISYIRVSKSKQAQQGVSLDDQRHRHDAFANAHHYQITASFTDVGPASYEENGSKREGFNDAWKLALRNDWDVMVTVPSRFTRTMNLYDEFRRKGGRLICTELGIDATDDDIRNFLHNEIVANEQRQRLARPAQQRARAEGKLDGHTVPDWGRSKSVRSRQARALRGYAEFEQHERAARAEGARTPRELAEAFKMMGFRTPSKMPWKANNVRRVQETIAEMKAASANPRLPDARHRLETEPKPHSVAPPSGRVEIEGAAASANIQNASYALAEPRDLDDGVISIAEAPAGCPFTEDELAEFRALLNVSAIAGDEDKKASFIRRASHPRLSQQEREQIVNWMARKRADRPVHLAPLDSAVSRDVSEEQF